MWELGHKNGWVLKNWCFWTVVLEKTLESPWTARRSNQSILKEINPEYSLEGRMLKLKLQYLGHLIWKANSLEKTMILGKTEDRKRREWEKMKWFDSNTDSKDMYLSKLQEILKDREAWSAVVHAVAKSQTWLSNWIATTTIFLGPATVMGRNCLVHHLVRDQQERVPWLTSDICLWWLGAAQEYCMFPNCHLWPDLSLHLLKACAYIFAISYLMSWVGGSSHTQQIKY